jgi:hypothetical protein
LPSSKVCLYLRDAYVAQATYKKNRGKPDFAKNNGLLQVGVFLEEKK